MIETILLSASLAFINPADPSLSTIYPSGIKDIDNKIFSAPPTTQNPLLRIGTPLKNSDGYIIQPGCYLVRPVDEKLEFYQEGKVAFELPVFETTMVKNYKKRAIVYTEVHENEKMLIIYHRENIVKKAILPLKEL